MMLFGDLPIAPGHRDPLERYYTPDWLARWVVSYLPWRHLRGLGCADPHAGGGAFLRAVREAEPAVLMFGSDIDGGAPAVVSGDAWQSDFLATDPSSCEGIGRIIGNPPFSNAEDHVAQALRIAPDVAFLLPMSRLETPGRMRFYRQHMPSVIVPLPERVWPGSRQIGLFWWQPGARRSRCGPELDLSTAGAGVLPEVSSPPAHP